MASVATVGTSASTSKISDEVQITFADQQMINTFARRNSKFNELKADIEKLKKEIQTLEDAGDELLLLEGDSDTVPYHIGDVFFTIGMEEAQSLLDQQKEENSEKLQHLEKNVEDMKSELAALKVELYSKFGNNINLEEEDE